MGSFIYPSSVARMLAGDINYVRDKFAVMLLDGSHKPSEDDDDRRDLDGEVSGQGYLAGGQEAEVMVLVDPNGKTTIILGAAVWINSSLAARYAAYYRKSGNEVGNHLVALIDFGKEVQSLNDLFSLTESEIEISTR